MFVVFIASPACPPVGSRALGEQFAEYLLCPTLFFPSISRSTDPVEHGERAHCYRLRDEVQMLCPAGFRVGCDGRAAGQRDRFEAIAQNRNEDLHGTQSVTGEVKKKNTHTHKSSFAFLRRVLGSCKYEKRMQSSIQK